MRRTPVIGRIIVFVLALVLGTVRCSAEGLMFFEQHGPADGAGLPHLRLSDARAVVNLAGSWDVAGNDDDSKMSTRLPGSFWGADHDVEYRRTFALHDSLREMHFQLYLPEVHYRVEVWLNGRLLTSSAGNHLGVSCSIPTDQLRFGEDNEILLRVNNRLSATSTLPLSPQLLEPRNYGGIFSGVYLRAVPGWSIDDIRITPAAVPGRESADREAIVRIVRNGTIPAISDSGTGSTTPRVEIVVRDSTGAVVAEGRRDFPESTTAGADHFTIGLSQVEFAPWSPDHPVLYDIEAKLVAGDAVVDRVLLHVGFKEFEVRGGSFYLNGSRWMARGIDYVPEWEGSGRSLSYSQVERDLKSMKEAGFNLVRVPCSAPPPSVVDAADRIGMMLFVEAGVDGVPAAFTVDGRFREVCEQTYTRLIDQHGDHVSVAAWGIGSQLNWSSSMTRDFAAWLRGVVAARDSRPCYVESGDLSAAEPADFVLAGRNDDLVREHLSLPDRADFPVIVSRVGRTVASGRRDGTDPAVGLINQAEFIQRRVEETRSSEHIDGFLVHAYSDYHIASPIFAQPHKSDPYLYAVGLVALDRSERPAYAMLKELSTAGQVASSAPVAPRESIPVALPVIGIGALMLIMVSMRRNNVFRHNLKRVFFHPHGFHMDLRYRRFLHTSQFVLVWLLESITLAVILVSILFAFRNDLTFDHYLTHFMPSTQCKAELVDLVWNPLNAVAVFTAVFLGLGLLLTLLVRLLSVPFRERMDLWQAANYVVWSFAAVLIALPVGVILFRLLETPEFKTPALVFVGLVLMWCIQRLLGALRIGLGTSAWRIYTAFFLLGGLLILGGAALMNHQFGTMAYMDHFYRVLSAR